MKSAVAIGALVLLLAQNACSSEPSVVLGGKQFVVEVADSPRERAKGLMFRQSMPADHGMLFTFLAPGMRVFWMKNTLIPLDILFFDDDARLVNWRTAEPCRSDPCSTYASAAPARYILELNAGTAKELGVERGDRLEMHLP